jgi:CubicO group peptidase (beta-lactamase class C family)
LVNASLTPADLAAHRFENCALTIETPGASYRNQWWVTHNAHGAYMARGVHGQGIYIDPKAEMVIARYASHPVAANAGNDPATLPAYMALARDLIAGG